MKLMKLGMIGSAMTVALIAVAAPAVAGTLLNGATVTNGARGVTNGSVINGPVKVIMPNADNGKQIDIMTANINLPSDIFHHDSGIDWHTHPGPTFGIVTGGGELTIIDDDCVAHVYATGQAFVAPVNPHTARNFSDLPVTVRATFFMSHSTPPTPPTKFVSPADDDVLDAYCGLAE